MKTKIVSKILLSLALVFVLGSAITQVHSEEEKLPVITIHSTGDVTRGKTGSCIADVKSNAAQLGVPSGDVLHGDVRNFS